MHNAFRRQHSLLKHAHLELPEAILKPNTPTDTWPIINNNMWSFTSLQNKFRVISNVSQLVWPNLSM